MTEAPTTQERYAAAVNSSSLRTEADTRGDVDMLIAVGWCKSKFGAALMRLQSEWDGAERLGIKIPLKPTKRAIMAEAQVTIKNGIRKVTTQSREAAAKRLTEYYENEMAKVVRALKSLPEVARQLEIKLLLDGHSADQAIPILLYWLDPVCKVCAGRKFQLAPCKTKLSERACGCCKGLGTAPVPCGEAGRVALDCIEYCLACAQAEVRKSCSN